MSNFSLVKIRLDIWASLIVSGGPNGYTNIWSSVDFKTSFDVAKHEPEWDEAVQETDEAMRAMRDYHGREALGGELWSSVWYQHTMHTATERQIASKAKLPLRTFQRRKKSAYSWLDKYLLEVGGKIR